MIIAGPSRRPGLAYTSFDQGFEMRALYIDRRVSDKRVAHNVDKDSTCEFFL